ncbi:EAL domain-containing protein [Sphingomonas sp. PB2P12]|uniref:putative bifunctional diguanylate cyclase/phosphodiesterase n=1 Tax=Sphingomonas sandaracina TaxID=3096157 RepID=UPI002FCAAD68
MIDGSAHRRDTTKTAIRLAGSLLNCLPFSRVVAGPRAVIVLLVLAVTLCLGTLIYVQHTNTVIVNRDMDTAVSLSEIAARFDHEDGNLYRLMVDEAAGVPTPGGDAQLARISSRIDRISADLVAEQRELSPADRARAANVVVELAKYRDAVDVVSSMLEIDFATSVAMLRPFRANADRVLVAIKAMAASGMTNAHRHAEEAALRTRLLVALVTGAMLIVAALSYAWLALAARRGTQLRAEIIRRGAAEQEALLLARTDALTGLVNRRVFVGDIESAIGAAHASSRRLSVILTDLDSFKDANDTHGHAAGDTVLKAVAHRLRIVFGPDSTIARLGGDEFAILLPQDQDSDDVMALAKQASLALHEPLAWRGNMIKVGASIGVSRFPEDGSEPDDLLHAADIAMYEAKRNRQQRVCLFAPAMELDRTERRRMEQDLRDGIPRGEIRPFYQPIMRFADGELYGFEVLARWYHPRLGMLAPDKFIRVAETTGQITEMTKSILRQACADLHRMPAHLRIAVNISPMQLEEPNLAEALIEIIRDAGVAPSRVEIEITEDAVMDDIAAAERVLNAFRTSGISIALDDFGTGYSSLSHLRRLKFDKIKIDQSFVASMHESVESEKLIDAIIALAINFGMEVTAEGIEDDRTARLLAQRGCTQGQGYFFGKPTSLAQALMVITRSVREAA